MSRRLEFAPKSPHAKAVELHSVNEALKAEGLVEHQPAAFAVERDRVLERRSNSD